jgi:hypothetical protein
MTLRQPWTRGQWRNTRCVVLCALISSCTPPHLTVTLEADSTANHIVIRVTVPVLFRTPHAAFLTRIQVTRGCETSTAVTLWEEQRPTAPDSAPGGLVELGTPPHGEWQVVGRMQTSFGVGCYVVGLTDDHHEDGGIAFDVDSLGSVKLHHLKPSHTIDDDTVRIIGVTKDH